MIDSYTLIALKFAIGIVVVILQINIWGKYEFSVNTPLNQIQNYVLGDIIGGIIYNDSISIITFIIVLHPVRFGNFAYGWPRPLTSDKA